MSGTAPDDRSQAEADVALARLRVDALFTRNPQGGLLTLNELEPVPPPSPAPRIYLGLTAGGIVRGYRQDVPALLQTALEQYCQDATLLTPSHDERLSALRDVLGTNEPRRTWTIATGPAYVFPTVMQQSAEVIAIEPGQESLLAEHFPFTATWLSERWPCYGIVVDGHAVSICYSARRTNAVAEAGVDTVEICRGRGYAALGTAAWATAIRAAGITPVYSTSDDNLASQAVARKLGLRLFCRDVQVE